MQTRTIRIRNQVRSTVFLGGTEILHNPGLNKGTAFTDAERDALGLRGLLPPRVHTLEEQCGRSLENFYRKPNDLERYIYMTALQDRNETLFYKLVMDNLEEMMPIIYTPTVGQACMEYGHILRRSRGLFITARDRGHIAEVVANWSHTDIRIIVVTDGERILGLGDLGANGMGIPVGKTSLYTACGGLDPSVCLPVTIDVGTENQGLVQDPLYLGTREGRIRGEAYVDLFEEFVDAVQEVFPHAVLQCEDFATENAFGLLERYRDRVCLFNDDIQGTAAVILAGLYSTLRITGEELKDQRILFLGAGEAGLGAGGLIVSALMDEGLSEEDARERCWFVDSKGLVVRSREKLSERKRRFAQDFKSIPDLQGAVEAVKPTAIVGVSGQQGMFSQSVLQTMAANNPRPIVFALSNPTSKSECTAEEAYGHTGGKAIFAGGSPFGPVSIGTDTHLTGQGNNVYIFPGIGMGAVATAAPRITDDMFLAAARAVASQMLPAELAAGLVFPSLSRIREVSLAVAVATAEIAYREELATRPRPNDLERHIRDNMYQPEYPVYA
jgi:malate dehydrogenase (oxaloacetate-decarboxylating)(NADP+)